MKSFLLPTDCFETLPSLLSEVKVCIPEQFSLGRNAVSLWRCGVASSDFQISSASDCFLFALESSLGDCPLPTAGAYVRSTRCRPSQI